RHQAIRDGTAPAAGAGGKGRAATGKAGAGAEGYNHKSEDRSIQGQRRRKDVSAWFPAVGHIPRESLDRDPAVAAAGGRTRTESQCLGRNAPELQSLFRTQIRGSVGARTSSQVYHVMLGKRPVGQG